MGILVTNAAPGGGFLAMSAAPGSARPRLFLSYGRRHASDLADPQATWAGSSANHVYLFTLEENR
jgi:hypothetical protein